MKSAVIATAFVAILLSNASFTAKGVVRPVQSSPFGNTKDGQPITRYVLTNQKGIEAVVINYGATLQSLRVPDRSGKSEDIVLGYDDVTSYEDGKAFFGGTIGRYGNRIADRRLLWRFEVNHVVQA